LNHNGIYLHDLHEGQLRISKVYLKKLYGRNVSVQF